MAFFVEYAPDDKRDKKSILDNHLIEIRIAKLNDCAAMAKIETDRREEPEYYDQNLIKWQNKVTNQSSLAQIFVAVLISKDKPNEQITGFSNVEYCDSTNQLDEVSNKPFTAPSGWYLLGLNVDSTFRRLGIGNLLTQARIDLAAKNNADKIYYYTNPQNITSMAFHANLGFERINQELTFPNRPTFKTFYFVKTLNII